MELFGSLVCSGGLYFFSTAPFEHTGIFGVLFFMAARQVL
jgi:hypothetical protein